MSSGYLAFSILITLGGCSAATLIGHSWYEIMSNPLKFTYFYASIIVLFPNAFAQLYVATQLHFSENARIVLNGLYGQWASVNPLLISLTFQFCLHGYDWHLHRWIFAFNTILFGTLFNVFVPAETYNQLPTFLQSCVVNMSHSFHATHFPVSTNRATIGFDLYSFSIVQIAVMFVLASVLQGLLFPIVAAFVSVTFVRFLINSYFCYWKIRLEDEQRQRVADEAAAVAHAMHQSQLFMSTPSINIGFSNGHVFIQSVPGTRNLALKPHITDRKSVV